MNKGILNIVFYLSLVLIVGVEFFIPRGHSYLQWETLPGFYVIFGFAGCVLIILIAKTLGVFIRKKEDYYD
jgi:hypothetical protein